MTGNLKLLIKFVWEFMGTVRFRNDHVAAILGQFCDSDLEVAFRRDACFVRNLEGVDLSKDKAPAVIITFLKRIMVLLQSPGIIIRIDNGTKFENQVLKEYFESVGISHQMSSVRIPQQNRVVERRNKTLLEAA
nr:putative ribonuclease H-like domain-containing protein [Tanacetum cinerariifolium]